MAKLTRKYRSTLRLSSTGKAARNDPAELIKRLTAATFARYPEDFFRDSMVVGLLLISTGAHTYGPQSRSTRNHELKQSVAELLGAMHWQFNGAAPEAYQVTMSTDPLNTILNPLRQNIDLSPELARYCAWQALKA